MEIGVTGQVGPAIPILAKRRETGSAVILLLLMVELPVLVIVWRQKVVQVQNSNEGKLSVKYSLKLFC